MKRKNKLQNPLALALAVTILAALAGCFLSLNRVQPSADPALMLPAGSIGSAQSPVRCDGPPGEREYLDRLRGPDGAPVVYRRLGNVGVGAYGHVVDLYLVESADGSVRREVFMDMYYPGHRETEAVEGFFLLDQIL